MPATVLGEVGHQQLYRWLVSELTLRTGNMAGADARIAVHSSCYCYFVTSGLNMQSGSGWKSSVRLPPRIAGAILVGFAAHT